MTSFIRETVVTMKGANEGEYLQNLKMFIFDDEVGSEELEEKIREFASDCGIRGAQIWSDLFYDELGEDATGELVEATVLEVKAEKASDIRAKIFEFIKPQHYSNFQQNN